jgi:uncharacterized phage protein gp47/JayE
MQTLLEEALDAAFPGTNVRAGVVQNIIGILAEDSALAWEAIQAIYGAAYGDSATGILLDQVCALTGTTRRAATYSRVTATVNLDAGVTLAAGKIAAVAGSPDAQLASVEAVTNSGGAPANVSVIFEALTTGPIAAPAGYLTAIVTPSAGWNSITNVASATLGETVETDAALRLRRVVELAGAGSGTLASIRAAVSRVTDVLSVTAYENTSSIVVDGRPGKSFEIVVYDVLGAASDAEIAQAIYDHKPAGIESYGVADAGAATADDGTVVTVDFTRATSLRTYVDAVIVLEPGADGPGVIALAQAAVEARGAAYAVGETAYASQLICALQDVVGARAVTSLTVGTIATPVTTSVTATYAQVIRIAFADVDVTT